MPYSILVLPDHSWLKNKYLMCLKLGCLSLLWPSGLVCKLDRTPLPVIGETEGKLMDADALPVLVTKDFQHELLIGSDAISWGNGEIDYGARKVTSFGQNFSITLYTDFIPHRASVSEMLPPLHQWRHEGVYRHFYLIILTTKLNGCWPFKLRAYCTSLWIKKVVNDMIKAGII